MLCSLVLATALGAEPAATDVFQRFADRVYQVCLVSPSTTSREACGSGFFVTADGLFVTNFHVVDSYVWHPEDFRAELRPRDGRARPAEVLDVDAANDLALLRVEGPVSAFFPLEDIVPPRGAKVFSLGNPLSMGLAVVEGTFNDLLEDRLVPLFHFSGSLNPGVSGGPTVDGEGRVIGVNVSAYGDQLSQLVPVKAVLALLKRHAPGAGTNEVGATGSTAPVPSPPSPPSPPAPSGAPSPLPSPSPTSASAPPPSPLVERVRETLLSHQDRVSRLLLEGAAATTRLGDWTLPGNWTVRLPEYGGPMDKDSPERLVDQTYYKWVDPSERSVRADERTGTLALEHVLVTSRGGGATALYRTASRHYAWTSAEAPGNSEDFHTRWRCEERLVKGARARLKALLCLRGYTKLEGLYDLVLRTMTFDSNTAVVASELRAFGFAHENLTAFAGRFLEGIAWTPSSSR